MGYTTQSITTGISQIKGNYNMWNKGGIIVILSQTKLAKNVSFLGKFG